MILIRLFLKQFGIGVFDKKFFPGEKRAFRCSKNLHSKIPDDVLPKCMFENRNDLFDTVEAMCDDMEAVLNWTFENCHVKGNGNRRAIGQIRKTKAVCNRMKKVLKKNKKPVEPPNGKCPYGSKNRICDGSNKCGLIHFGSCVQLEVFK